MDFSTRLVPATLIRRYKRFLADVTLDSGEAVTAHCANPGAMLGLAHPGARIWLEPNNNPKRKLRYSWKLEELTDGSMVGIDTSIPNKIVKEALLSGQVVELDAYGSIRAEVSYGKSSRIDFLLSGDNLPNAYVEVKNVHFHRKEDWAEFPDCVTERGTKHLGELANMTAAGNRAVMLYLVQRTDCRRFRLARDLDPKYATAFDDACAAGVEMLCYGTDISQRGVYLSRSLPVSRE